MLSILILLLIILWIIYLYLWGWERVVKQRPKISLLIPFRSDNSYRRDIFRWLVRYWRAELPDAQIVIGHSRNNPFSKTEALNDAAERATGRVLVILDADAYIKGDVIEYCADRILEELDNHLWYVPYKNLYRLNDVGTELILDSDPANPLRLDDPPPLEYLDIAGANSKYGHRYGAMIMMFPREALNVLGCFDERFTGWGGEDVAFLRAMDTLYGKHKITTNPVFHMWHPKIGSTYKTRMWVGQTEEEPNKQLAIQYHKATRRPEQMRRVVDAGCAFRNTFAKRLQRLIWRFLFYRFNIPDVSDRKNRRSKRGG